MNITPQHIPKRVSTKQHMPGKALYKLLSSRRMLRVYGLVVIVFVVLNLVVGLVFAQRSYPNTRLGGKQLGSVSHRSLAERMQKLTALPKTIELVHQDKTTALSPTDLGIQIDYQALAQQVQRERSWLPVANFITAHDVPLSLKIDNAAFQKKLDALATIYKLAPVDAKIGLQNGVFSIHNESAGYDFNSNAAKNDIPAALAKGSSHIDVPVVSQAAHIKTADLQTALADLQAQQKVSITYRDQAGKSSALSAADISGFYAVEGNGYGLQEAKIQEVIARTGRGFGMGVQNMTEAVAATKDAVQHHKSLTFTLVPIPIARKTFTYCVAVRGVDASQLPALTSKLAAVYGDARGWWLDGQVAFSHAEAGCNFTVWLAAADQMPGFGPICDTVWSCSVGPNVAINFDRWRYTSEAWSKQGGSLEDYRAMVINHETGHWLGFGHSYCPGPGQPAPVMQQQSIDLQGCAFNPWPTATERATLKARLNL